MADLLTWVSFERIFYQSVFQTTVWHLEALEILNLMNWNEEKLYIKFETLDIKLGAEIYHVVLRCVNRSQGNKEYLNQITTPRFQLLKSESIKNTIWEPNYDLKRNQNSNYGTFGFRWICKNQRFFLLILEEIQIFNKNIKAENGSHMGVIMSEVLY